jgi:hypothetical protein
LCASAQASQVLPTGRADDEDRLCALEPFAVGECGDEAGIETAAGARIEILEAGLGVLQTRLGEEPGESMAVAMGGLAFDEQREAVLEGQGRAGWQRELLFEGVRHAVEFQGTQLREGVLHDHRVSFMGHW